MGFSFFRDVKNKWEYRGMKDTKSLGHIYLCVSLSLMSQDPHLRHHCRVSRQNDRTPFLSFSRESELKQHPGRQSLPDSSMWWKTCETGDTGLDAINNERWESVARRMNDKEWTWGRGKSSSQSVIRKMTRARFSARVETWRKQQDSEE